MDNKQLVEIEYREINGHFHTYANGRKVKLFGSLWREICTAISTPYGFKTRKDFERGVTTLMVYVDKSIVENEKEYADEG